MRITLLILSCIIAIMFFILSRKMNVAWIKKSFKVYGMMFTVAATFICFIFIHENKLTIKSAIINFINIDVVEATDSASIGKAKEQLSRSTSNSIEIKNTSNKHSKRIQLEAPSEDQLPELPRGCEVTSLSMLLQYHDIDIDKMELAKKIKKDPSTYEVVGSKTHFGNPYKGFVGDMYSFDTPGMGVYHGPIADLAEKYVGDRVHDFTGEKFSSIVDELNNEHPVWVIINAAYKKLPDESFTTWHTADGPIDITMREHSVLITGYDEKYIYFNDPLQREEKALIEDFKAAWIQMGKQAITIY